MYKYILTHKTELQNSVPALTTSTQPSLVQFSPTNDVDASITIDNLIFDFFITHLNIAQTATPTLLPVASATSSLLPFYHLSPLHLVSSFVSCSCCGMLLLSNIHANHQTECEQKETHY